MILSDGEIRKAINTKEITIDPVPQEEQYTTSALDLYLGEGLFEYKTLEELAAEEPAGAERELVVNPVGINLKAFLDKYSKPLPQAADGSYLLPPLKFVLGITREYVDFPTRSKIAARVEGRSTLARLGLLVHLTAPTIHAGFSGRIVLEMYNLGNFPLRLIPGKLAVCQLIFERLGRIPRGAKAKTRYIGQKTVR